MDRIKEQAPSIILSIDEPPNFQIQVANGQLEKPIATATLKLDIGNHTFGEHFVVMKNLTGVTEQTRSQRDVVTGVHAEVMYCSPSTSSGKC